MFLGAYRIIYEIGAESIQVLTVMEGHRLLRTENVQPSPEE